MSMSDEYSSECDATSLQNDAKGNIQHPAKAQKQELSRKGICYQSDLTPSATQKEPHIPQFSNNSPGQRYIQKLKLLA